MLPTIAQAALYSFYDTDAEPIAAFLDYIVTSYRLDPIQHVCDLGCGPGRLFEAFVARGLHVTALEPDADYRAAAAQRAQRLANVVVRQGGFEDVDRGGPFDLVAAINGPYSYVLELRERREGLRRCAAALRTGGVLVLDLANFWWVLRNYREPDSVVMHVEGREVKRTARQDLDYHRCTLTHHDTFTWSDHDGTEQRVDKSHVMALIGFAEIELFLAEAGFGAIRTFDGYGERQSAPVRGRRLLVAAQKQA